MKPTLTLSELKAVVRSSMSDDEVRAFGDLRKRATWEYAHISIEEQGEEVQEVNEVTEVDSTITLTQPSILSEDTIATPATEAAPTEDKETYETVVNDDDDSSVSIYDKDYVYTSNERARHRAALDAFYDHNDETLLNDFYYGDYSTTSCTGNVCAAVLPVLPEDEQQPQPTPMNHALPMLMLITLLIVVSLQLAATLTPAVNYVRVKATRRASAWKREVMQLTKLHSLTATNII